MKIIYSGMKRYSKESEPRKVYKIEHKGKSIEYMPPNTWNFQETWRQSIRDCIIRTLGSKKYNEIWA